MNHEPFKYLNIVYLCLCLYPIAAHADIYEYIDVTGISHYSDLPNHDQYVLILKTVAAPSTKVANGTTRNTNKASYRQSQSVVKVGVTPTANPQLLAQIKRSAQSNRVESELIHAVMQVESAYNVHARSHKGAQGLMQLMPQTAKRFGVKNSFDSAQNIEGGTKYLKELLNLFNNDIPLTLAAYNAGENAVIKYGRKIPPYKETQAYVPKVLKIYNALLNQRQ